MSRDGRRYEDAFRAMGHALDKERFVRLALVETPVGFVIKGQADVGAGDEAFALVRQTRFLSDEVVRSLRDAGRQRRGTQRSLR